MRKHLLRATVSCLALFSVTEAHSGGIPVIDAAALSQATAVEVRDAYDSALKYAQMLKDYALELDQYRVAVENSLAIPQQAINTVTGYYSRAQNLALTAEYIVGGEGSMLSRARMFSSMARGGASMPQSAAASMEMIRTQAALQIQENARLLGLESERAAINQAMLSSAQNNSVNAIGRMQAVTASSQNVASAAAQLQQVNARLENQIAVQQVKDAMAIGEDERFGLERTADIEAARAQASSPATIASPITWGR